MIAFFNFFSGIITFIILLITYFIYKYAIKPYRLLQFYKKQGFETCFYFAISGDLANNFENVEKHGDVFYAHKQKALKDPKPRSWVVNFGDTAYILLKDHELLKDFFLNHEQFYEKHVSTMAFLKELAGDGILLSGGAIWRRHRKIVSAAFNFEFLKEMIPEVVEIANECLENLKKKDMNEIDILSEMQAITGEIVGRIFLGAKFSKYEIDGVNLTKCLIDFLVEIGNEGQKPLNSFLGQKFVRKGFLASHRRILDKIKKMKGAIKELATERMESVEKEQQDSTKGRRRVNLVELFYKQRKQNPQEAFTEDELVDEFVTFFVAGTETTGHVLAMATYFLLKNPQFKDKILQEVNKFFTNPEDISVDILNKMDYMTAFLKETMRMSPVDGVLFDRIATQDHELGGIKIKKGTLVNVSFLSNYFDPDYHSDPYTFNSERWLDESKTKESVSKNPFIYTPFSAGTRNCLGQHLAMNQARIIFSLFLKKYNYELTDKNYVLKMTERSLYEPHDFFYYKLQIK